jgi:hypothetical protein
LDLTSGLVQPQRIGDSREAEHKHCFICSKQPHSIVSSPSTLASVQSGEQQGKYRGNNNDLERDLISYGLGLFSFWICVLMILA